MLKREDYLMIQHKHDDGVYIKDIAEELGVHPRTVSQDAAHTYESLVRSFAYLGGVTKTVLVDNQKSAVIAHRVGEGVQFHPRFLDLAGHYGFVPKACRPYRARTKGKTERMVRYVKEHFFVRYRQFETLAHLNQQLESWLREEADPRAHGTHRLRPAGAGWQSIPAHHAALWQDSLQVERRGLAVYEEAGQWN